MKRAYSQSLKKSVSAILATVMTISLFPFSTGIEVYAEDDPYVELSQTLTAQDTFANDRLRICSPQGFSPYKRYRK